MGASGPSSFPISFPSTPKTAPKSAPCRAIGQRRVDRWISVGPGLATGIPGVDHVRPPSRHHALLNSADLADLEGWNVLVKGARDLASSAFPMRWRPIPHATVLDLNLGRLAHNLQQFRDRFNKPIMGMVKAFAYGAGDAVAVELDQLGIDRLAVAFAEEGIALRKRGVRCPILVLNADHRRYADLIQWRLEPEIHRLKTSTIGRMPCGRSGPVGQQADRAGVHLKVETGMHRLGFEEDNGPPRAGAVPQMDFASPASTATSLPRTTRSR